MQHTKTVCKIFINHEKEEAYLNKMNRKGWKLSSVRLTFYTFVKTDPNEYMTVFHFADRQNQTSFIRMVTECGCEIANQSNEGKSILFYVNVPIESENIVFLTDNSSKLDFNKRLNNTRKRELIMLFTGFIPLLLLALYPMPSIIKLLKYAPEELLRICTENPIGFATIPFMMICTILCGATAAYIFASYCKTKRTIKEIMNEMKIFE